MLQTIQNKDNTNLSLKSQDISCVLKHFSLVIQQRIQQIDRTHNFFTCLNSNLYDKSQLETQILQKYSGYKTTNHNEIKLMQRFCERVIQIFQFYKQKTDKPYQLNQIQQKINDRIKQIIRNQFNFHFFINNRPKTQKLTHVRTAVSRSVIKNSQDQLFIAPPSLYKDKQNSSSSSKKNNNLDLNYAHNNFILPPNKKTKTQQSQREIDIGQLFRCIFSILKKGYLMKLKLQQKRNNKQNHNINIKDKSINSISIKNDNQIAIEGTGAILRSYSEKGKQNNQNLIIGMEMKEKLISIINANGNGNANNQLNYCQGKKQQPLLKKLKTRSILGKYDSSTALSLNKKVNQKVQIRQVDKKLLNLSEILDIDKYFILRSLKQPQQCIKQMMKRNNLIENQRNKFKLEYNQWNKRNKINNNNDNGNNNNDNKDEQHKYIQQQNEQEQFEIQFKQDLMQQNLSNGYDVQSEQKQQKFINNDDDIEIEDFLLAEDEIFSKRNQQKQNIMKITTQSVTCSSRINQDKVLVDKSQNQIIESKSFKQLALKRAHHQFRFNLQNLIENKQKQSHPHNFLPLSSNLLPHKHQRQSKPNLSSSSNKNIIQQQNYEDIFVPLLPRKSRQDKNDQENTVTGFSIKRKNILANAHPINRCRVYRQKRMVQKSIMVLNPINFSKQADNDIHNQTYSNNYLRLKNSII